MSQPSVTAFFNSRKRPASDEIRNKSKVLILEQPKNRSYKVNDNFKVNANRAEDSTEAAPLTPVSEESTSSPKLVYAGEVDEKKISSVVRNIQFDSVKPSSAAAAVASPKMTPKASSRARSSVRTRKFSVQEGQTDIRETFLKMGADRKEPKIVPFEKMGALSPKKKCSVAIESTTGENKKSDEEKAEPAAAGSVTPKKAGSSFVDRLAKQELSYGEIKNKITRSSRLAELRASIARIKNCQEKLKKFEEEEEKGTKKPCIKKFEKIQLEVPVSPSKAARSPSKLLLTPTKKVKLPESASPQRRLLLAPKEPLASPVKSSPTKAPAYQRFQTLVDSGTPTLPLPYNYRFLAEAFRCVDTVAAMLYNRKEVITFKKLKPAVQELLRRNFTLEHLAQIKTIYAEAFVYRQEKLRNFGSTSKQDKYELVLVPVVEAKNGRNTPDPDNVLKSGAETNMGPGVMLDRRRRFYSALLDKVKTVHEKFLLSLESPMMIPKEKITRWHPEFDVETCPTVELAELPQAPNVEKAHSANQVLEKAKSLFNCNTRMEKALQRLADSKMTSRSVLDTAARETTLEKSTDEPRQVEITVVDTPPATPTTQSSHLSSAFKGIPKALLERVRAKQAAKALEAMTRTPTADKEAAIYSRLPEMAKILRSIFVAEKKGVLPLETVIVKLDNSYRTKMTPNELEEHIRLICKLLPTFACLQKVRLIDYLKIAKTADIVKVVKRLELIANDKRVDCSGECQSIEHCRMVFLTSVQFAKRVKSRQVLVLVESTLSGHGVRLVRERLADKLEFMKFDPWVRENALYREKKRVRSIK